MGDVELQPRRIADELSALLEIGFAHHSSMDDELVDPTRELKGGLIDSGIANPEVVGSVGW